MRSEDRRRTGPRLPRIRSTRPGVPALPLLVAVLVLGATVLAVASRPPGPEAPVSPLLAVPALTHSDRTAPLAPTHPAGDSATVLDTISTLNGTTRSGNRPYLGGDNPLNVTVAGNRIAVIGDYSGNLLLVNATNGALVAAPSTGGLFVASAFDELTGELYVTDFTDRSVAVYDPTDGTLLQTLPVPGYPQAIAFDPEHDQIIVLIGPGVPIGYDYDTPSAVLFLNPETGAILANDSVGEDPVGLAVDPWSNELYVANTGAIDGSGTYANVTVFSTTTHAHLATIPAGGGPIAVSFDPTNGTVFVANADNDTVSVFNGSTHALVTTIAISEDPAAMTFDPRAQEIDLVSWSYSSLIRINATSDAVIATVYIGPVGPEGIAYSEATNRLYVSDVEGNDLTGYNATTRAIETYTPFGLDPIAATLDTDSGTLYVVNSFTGNLSYISVATNQLLGNFSAGPYPTDLAYDNASGRIYVVVDTDALTVVNPADNTVVGMIPVGQAPRQVVYDSSNQRLYVVNENSQNISVVSGTTGSVLGSVTLPPDVTPYSEAVDTATNVLWVASFTGSYASSLTPINLTTDSTGPSFTTAGYADEVAYDPGSGDLLVTVAPGNGSLPAVWVIDPASGAQLETVPGDGFYGTAGWLPGPGLMVWGSFVSDSLTMLAGSPGGVVVSVPVGEGPIAAIPDSENGRIYVVNEYSSSVSVVSLSVSPDLLTVATSPVACGPVELSGTPTNGLVSLSSGVYPAVAPACYNYAFQGWSVSGNVSVETAANADTEVTVSGNGTLTAVLALSPGARFGIAVVVTPSSCGSVVTLGGQDYASGTPLDLAPAPYSLAAAPCSGYAFSAWQLTGDVSLVLQGPLGGVLTVAGNGTVTAVYVAAAGGTTSSTGGSNGYSTTELVAFVAAGVLAGALVGVLVGRRGPPPTPTPPPDPPRTAT